MVAWNQCCERPSVDGTLIGIEPSHIVRYELARQFVQGKTVLDGACGCGYGASILDAATYLGIDSEEENTRYGHYHYGKPSREFRQADLESMAELGEFGAIISFETIEHLQNPEAWLGWAASRTNLFIGSTPIWNPRGLHSPHHVKEYEVQEFVGLLRRYWNSHILLFQDRRGLHLSQPPHEMDPIAIVICGESIWL
jgi:hypothetical protein